MNQTEELLELIKSSPVFAGIPPDELGQIAKLLQIKNHPAGTIILKQGDLSSAVYIILSGRLAIRVRRGTERETVAWLQPPDVFGELSFVTGRACIADVEVVVDAQVALLTKESIADDAPYSDDILRGITRMIAERLQASVSGGSKAVPAPVVLLSADSSWDAPRSFPAELAKSLQRETGGRTLLVEIGGEPDQEIETDGAAAVCRLQARSDGSDMRSAMEGRLAEWKGRFANIILRLGGAESDAIARDVAGFANWHGVLLGPGSNPPPESNVQSFVVQSAASSRLPFLDGRHQLIAETAESERAYGEGGEVTPRFRRTVDSIARLIAGTQVGLALGGGAAWGWAHIGVMDVLERNGIPVDMIAGCSMGGVIGALRATGRSVAELLEIAEYWRTRTRRFIEWRVWRLCLINERMLRKTLLSYFDRRRMNQTEVPFWANAVDIQAGDEYILRDGPVWEAVRGSIALPGLLPPLPRGKRLLLDAGIADPVPVRLLRNMGAHFVIAVNAMVPPATQKLSTRYPLNLIEILSRCMFVMGHEIGQMSAEKAADVVFTPELGDISMLQFGRSPEIIQSGRQAAQKHLPAIKALYRQRTNRFD